MRQMNVVGKPYDQKGHVRFEAAGAGDGSLDTAPALDPTCVLGLRRGCTFNSKGKKEGLLLSRETPDFTLSGSLLLDFLG
jgi:hypothetical protein